MSEKKRNLIRTRKRRTRQEGQGKIRREIYQPTKRGKGDILRSQVGRNGGKTKADKEGSLCASIVCRLER